jgi:hypothetical protein
MSKRIILLVALFVAQPISLSAEGFGPDILVKLDLTQRADFERARMLDVRPVYRWGNQFYAITDGAGIVELDRARLPYEAIETAPFKTGYYYVGSQELGLKGAVVPLIGATVLDDLGPWRLWKADQPINPRNAPGADALYRITGDPIPLTYKSPLTVASTAIDDPLLDTIAARISPDSILAFDTRLVAFQTRYSFADSNIAAEDYLTQKFQSFGYTDVSRDTHWIEEQLVGHNIVCTKEGVAEPDKFVVVGAHFDSYNQDSDPMVFAPGADDNGSGTAAVLEIARVLADIPTQKTFIFICFDGEEQWLWGSEYYAERAAAAGMDIVLMLNMDMIGYNPDAIPDVEINSDAPSAGYADLASAIAESLGLIPEDTFSPSGNSDHQSFGNAGYHFIWAAEGDFNYDGWHTDIDILSRMNLPYWTDVVRVIGMTAVAVSEAPAPVDGLAIYDIGDGQSLEVRWDPVTALTTTGYHVYYGPATEVYTDTAFVPGSGTSSHQIAGLVEGSEYFVSVSAVNVSGWESVVRPEASGTPYLVPRSPANVTAGTEYHRIDLTWDEAVELDFDHYTIYRGVDSLSLTEYEPFLTATTYTDLNVEAGTWYYYSIVSVDHDGYTSALSPVVSSIPATFDQGILLMDLTSETISDPPEQQQYDVYNAIFSGYQHGYHHYPDYSDPVEKWMLGPYGTVYWIDDDLSWENWPPSHWSMLNWFLSYGNNLVIIGWQTPHEVESGALLYDQFRVSDVAKISAVDCLGGVGEDGFPDVVFDTAKVVEIFAPWDGKLGQIWWMTTADASAEVIMRYNSATDDPAREELPVAVRRNNGGTKAVLIGLPLYYMREADAQAMVSALTAWFDLVAAPGDLDASGFVDVVDVLGLADAVFVGTFPSPGYNCADVNADCQVTVLDLVYLIDYVFRGGPDPLEGCVN